MPYRHSVSKRNKFKRQRLQRLVAARKRKRKVRTQKTAWGWLSAFFAR